MVLPLEGYCLEYLNHSAVPTCTSFVLRRTDSFETFWPSGIQAPARQSPAQTTSSPPRVPLVTPLLLLGSIYLLPPATFGFVQPIPLVGRSTEDGGMPRSVTPRKAKVVAPHSLTAACWERTEAALAVTGTGEVTAWKCGTTCGRIRNGNVEVELKNYNRCCSGRNRSRVVNNGCLPPRPLDCTVPATRSVHMPVNTTAPTNSRR